MNMKIRITDDGDMNDINDIHAMLKEYNLSNREPSKNVPIGIFYEDENSKLSMNILIRERGIITQKN